VTGDLTFLLARVSGAFTRREGGAFAVVGLFFPFVMLCRRWDFFGGEVGADRFVDFAAVFFGARSIADDERNPRRTVVASIEVTCHER
jgi:hypothetical protein